MINWLNENAGFINVLIFLTTLLLGWISGVFKSLRRKPKFEIEIIPGPTFSSTFQTNNNIKKPHLLVTAIALYLNITNIGSAPASIKQIHLGYNLNIQKFGVLWIRYRWFRFWLKNQIVIMEDFRHGFAGNKKYYPFLFQQSSINPAKVQNLYLKEGQDVSGVIYYEQQESNSDFYPYKKKDQIKIKLIVVDSYGNKHKIIKQIPAVLITEARKYNPAFGKTFELLKKEREQNS